MYSWMYVLLHNQCHLYVCMVSHIFNCIYVLHALQLNKQRLERLNDSNEMENQTLTHLG